MNGKILIKKKSNIGEDALEGENKIRTVLVTKS